MSVSDGFFACGFFVDVGEWEVYFDEFFAVFWHGVEGFVVVNRYRIIDYFWGLGWLFCLVSPASPVAAVDCGSSPQ